MTAPEIQVPQKLQAYCLPTDLWKLKTCLLIYITKATKSTDNKLDLSSLPWGGSLCQNLVFKTLIYNNKTLILCLYSMYL